MLKKELIERSPLRLFEESIHGGLKAGETGIIASPAGIGKTSVLVQLALDKLLQGKKVIHVSFTQHARSIGTMHVLTWYEDIFEELTAKINLENAAEVKDEIALNRVLMNFNQNSVTIEQMVKSLRAMIIEGGFKADSIIIDGFDFTKADEAAIAGVKAFATEMGVSIWYSCSVPDASEGGDSRFDSENIPVMLSGFKKSIDIIVVLCPKSDHVEMSISKDRDSIISKAMAMELDPKTLLILEK